MTNFHKVLFALAGLAVSLPMYAVTPGTDPVPGTGSDADPYLPIYKRKFPRDPNRKRTPSRDNGLDEVLYVCVVNGTMAIDFLEDTESATVTLSTGAFPVFSAGIDRGYPCVELPDLSGDFILTVTFDNGDEYEGEISF